MQDIVNVAGYLANFDIGIDEILEWHDGPSLFTGNDRAGRRYIAVQVAATLTVTSWLCAAISHLALRCVRTGRADLRDAFRYTPTGYVELLSVDRNGRVSESVRLCADLPDDILPTEGERLALAA